VFSLAGASRAAPSTCGADVRPQQDEFFMLTHCQQFFNSFFASSPPVWQRAWGTWRPLSPYRLTRIQRLLQAACCTPRHLSTPFCYATGTSLPRPRSAARTWWTPRAVSVCQPYSPHPSASAACARPRRERPPGHRVRCSRRSRGQVCEAYVPSYLRETCPRTYERRPSYLRETKYNLTHSF
jgi:hypothetical protein